MTHGEQSADIERQVQSAFMGYLCIEYSIHLTIAGDGLERKRAVSDANHRVAIDPNTP
jgi:hypothetical protein